MILKLNVQILMGYYVPEKWKQAKAVSLFKIGHKRGVLFPGFPHFLYHHSYSPQLCLPSPTSNHSVLLCNLPTQSSRILNLITSVSNLDIILQLEGAGSYKTLVTTYVTTQYNTDGHYLSNPHNENQIYTSTETTADKHS